MIISSLSFYVRFVPCQTICLLTFILARALHDDAFETSFASFAEILQRPNLEDVDHISLKWKPEFQNKKIFPLTYHHYWELWTRTWFVAGTRNSVRPFTSKIQALIRICSRLAVERDRKAYFDEVDRLRASGISTINLPVVSPNPVRHVHSNSVTAAVHIGRLLHPGDRPPELTQTVGGLLVSFLASRFAEVEDRAPTITPPPPPPGHRNWVMVTFSRRSNLSRHHASQHLPQSFQQVFPCPECRQQGMEDYYVVGPQDWSSHVERVYGLIHTPNLRQPAPGKQPKSSKERSVRCLICEMSLFPGGCFSRHVNKTHSVLFKEPFPCPECSRGGVEKIITSFSAWLDHTSSVHGHDGTTGDLITWQAIPPREAKGKRKIDVFAHDGDVPKPTVKRRSTRLGSQD
ncbi:hypothetical protein V8F06_014393 [Rhypophila decipiens]